jgi:hypothetical protein
MRAMIRAMISMTGDALGFLLPAAAGRTFFFSAFVFFFCVKKTKYLCIFFKKKYLGTLFFVNKVP